MKKLYFLFVAFVLFLCFACLENNQRGTDIRKETEVPVDVTHENVHLDTNSVVPAKKREGFGADYENENRVIWQKPEMVVEMLGDLTGKTVADIGAGTGHFALRLAKKADKVIAVDIDKKFTSYIDSVKVFELPDNFQERLTTRLATEDNPNLRENEVDIAVIVNTYMYVGNRVDWLKKVVNGLKPGGEIIIIDFKKKRTPVGPPSIYRVPLYQAEEEMSRAGLVNVETNDAVLDYQYILIGQKK